MVAQYSAQVMQADAIFLDWDGCLAQGGELLPGAAEFLHRFAPHISILSNNSTDLPEDFSGFLESEGVHVPAERIFLAGHRAIHYTILKLGDAPVDMIASSRMRDYAHSQGLHLVGEHDADDQAVAVLLLRDTAFSYRTLQRAANQLKGGARLIVSNPDLTHPGLNGMVVPETGALLAALKACVQQPAADVWTIGKPSSLLFDFALQQAGIAPACVVMIGDNPTTDIKGAAFLGMQTILLDPGTGVTLETINEVLGENLA